MLKGFFALIRHPKELISHPLRTKHRGEPVIRNTCSNRIVNTSEQTEQVNRIFTGATLLRVPLIQQN